MKQESTRKSLLERARLAAPTMAGKTAGAGRGSSLMRIWQREGPVVVDLTRLGSVEGGADALCIAMMRSAGREGTVLVRLTKAAASRTVAAYERRPGVALGRGRFAEQGG